MTRGHEGKSSARRLLQYSPHRKWKLAKCQIWRRPRGGDLNLWLQVIGLDRV